MEFSTDEIVITGNSRLSRILLKKFDTEQVQAGRQVWESPPILPWEAWLRQLWGQGVLSDPAATPVLLNRSQELNLWEQIIGTQSRMMLLDARATAMTAMRAWSILHQWNLSLADPAFKDLPDTQAFSLWAQELDNQLRRRNWLTMAQVAAALGERIESGQLRLTKRISMAGFDEIAPSVQNLLNQIQQSGSSISIRPFSVLSNTEKPCLTPCEDPQQEVRQAAFWAREYLEKYPDSQIGIIIPGLSSIRSMTERIFDEVLHPAAGFSIQESSRVFHLSAGIPLTELPVISVALLILQLPSGLLFNDFSRLLRCPYLNLSPEDSVILDDQLRKQGMTAVDLQTKGVQETFSSFTEEWLNLPASAPPGEWSGFFLKLLKAAGWPGNRPLSSREYQITDRWKEVLSEFSRLDLVRNEMKYQDAVKQLEFLASTTIFGVQDADAPIQVMDMLEASGSSFDALWVAGLHDRAWPQPAQSNPFLPLALQRQHQTPQSSAERELHYAKRITQRLLDSAPLVICSYPLHQQDEELRASPLIQHLQWMDEKREGNSAASSLLQAAPEKELFEDPEVALPGGKDSQPGGTAVLKDQAACPFRAFATHRLNAREMEVPETGLTLRERGTIIHEVMSRFWRRLKTQDQLNQLSDQQVQNILKESIDQGMDHALRHSANGSLIRHRELEKKRLLVLLEKWMKAERARDPFTVVSTEEKTTVGIGGLFLHVQADRVDRFSDGSFGIVDYKTSKYLNVSSWDGDRLDEPQLPLYAVQHEGPVSTIQFGQLAAGKTGFVPEKPQPVQDRIEEWRSALTHLAEQFVAGKATVDPKKYPKTCELCGLQPFCRIDEIVNGETGEEMLDG